MAKKSDEYNQIDFELAQLVARRLEMTDSMTLPKRPTLEKWAEDLNIDPTTLFNVFGSLGRTIRRSRDRLERVVAFQEEDPNAHEIISSNDPVEVWPLMLSVTWPQATCVLVTATQYEPLSLVHAVIYPTEKITPPFKFGATLEISGGQQPYRVMPHGHNLGSAGEMDWIVTPALEREWSALAWILTPAEPTPDFWSLHPPIAVAVEKRLEFHPVSKESS